MTSLLSIQYVTSLPEVVHSEKELFKLRNILQQKRTTIQQPPPPLNNNRLAYVDALVDANALVIESIWKIPKSNNTAAVVPLRTFIQEVLKRSRTTYSTLQTALFYLFRSRPEIKLHMTRMQQQQSTQWEDAYVSCGRRMFLASLVVASKFVQDKTYRNSAWAKIAGLPVAEINAAERIFLNIIDYRLYISQPTFEKWHHLLHLHVEAKTLNQPNNLQDFSNLAFAPIELHHTPTPSFHYNYIHKPQQQTHCISPTTPTSSPPRNNNTTNHGWTIVLSPTTFLNDNRKRCYQQQQQSGYYPLPPPPHPPVLSMSLPSSINSSPMQTPTQISPVKMNNGTSVFNWSSPMSNKKRKYSTIEPNTRSYNISNVRQQSAKRFHP
ncbi:hypothetical protein HPULCUR_011560 [Helicostylum pulchrum]|uniref:Uncharacterized protein n=1 Tax=Helicostylum pulchrum TaxID=562976 RepID=A0ABP9YHX6_9FUNG